MDISNTLIWNSLISMVNDIKAVAVEKGLVLCQCWVDVMKKINVCMVVVALVVGMDIHNIMSSIIEDSPVVKQDIIGDGRRIPTKSFTELFCVAWLLNG